MKKSLIFLGMLSIGYAYAQQGNLGVNTDQPRATLDIHTTAENLVKTTNEGIIAPRLTKTRVANIDAVNLTEGTLVYVTDAVYTAGTDANKDNRVAKITEKGYYYYNGTEWVRTGSETEWTYDNTNSRINLKRSGNNIGFNNKVYYDTKNGNFINTDTDRFYKWWTENTLTNVADANFSVLHRFSSNIATMMDNFTNMYQKSLSYNHLEVNEKTNLGRALNPNVMSNHLRISPDNVSPIYWAAALSGSTSKADKTNTNFLVGSSGSVIVLDGKVSGYAAAGRFETFVNTATKQESTMSAVSSIISTGENMTSSIKNIYGVNTHVQFNNNSTDNTIDELASLFYGTYDFRKRQPKIPVLAGFYYGGVGTEDGGSLDRVEHHYGLYLSNVNRAQNNYAIYTNAGKVRFGDNVGVGVNNPNEKLEVSGAIKVASTTSTCTVANVGTIKFENDNFYGCKSTGWVLLNN